MFMGNVTDGRVSEPSSSPVQKSMQKFLAAPADSVSACLPIRTNGPKTAAGPSHRKLPTENHGRTADGTGTESQKTLAAGGSLTGRSKDISTVGKLGELHHNVCSAVFFSAFLRLLGIFDHQSATGSYKWIKNMFGGDGTGEEISNRMQRMEAAFSKNRTIIELRAMGLSPLRTEASGFE
ncbi:hypothetical protein GE21DRAFT_4939 [Neurospora crassa]|uniref:Uncharacterized protein n=1 Tax=Neurospora crassa (strain ATCC 24698 / 74-OR23-1A / CBS 708.71 / DSM 1257 / FGSC 987) TaxID=367110 RepID=Q7S308_NEUCR|nr:hypothetical protein NCU07540 [Neurospora crassa OR74A]EAA29817.1 hypothetical protein NCU07540 [Neurospora crassa OR74A]KHE81715.1 hypothetical protein GE21DRAFT_4939 [Neurospora crassa]|eukprot:XP_959053.1 hypothetical protein NCU07540 [Neurospora crassa OR74A]